MKITLNLKPLSVNEAWQGRRFKTVKYARFEQAALLLLPEIDLPLPPYNITICYHFNNKAADIDNPLKMTLDVLQKRYGINDKHVYRIELLKVICKKGDEKTEITFNDFQNKIKEK